MSVTKIESREAFVAELARAVDRQHDRADGLVGRAPEGETLWTRDLPS